MFFDRVEIRNARKNHNIRGWLWPKRAKYAKKNGKVGAICAGVILNLSKKRAAGLAGRRKKMYCPTCYNPLIVGRDDYDREIYYCAVCDHKLSKQVVDAWHNRCEKPCYVLDTKPED